MKIAIIGRGSAGRRHEQLFKDLGLDVSAYDTDQTKTDAASLEEALVGVSGIVVATPPGHRPPLLRELAKRGLPMLVEKPLAMESLGAEFLLDGPPILMGYVWRHCPFAQEFIRLTWPAEGTIHIRYGEHPSLRPKPSWLGEVASIWEYSHAMDFLLQIMPDFRIFKTRTRWEWTNLEATNGRSTVKLRTDFVSNPAQVWMAGGGHIWTPTRERLLAAYEAQTKHFVDVMTGGVPIVSAVEGLRVVRLTERCISWV